MSDADFVLGHAAHPDWRSALDDGLRQLRRGLDSRGKAAPPCTLGWCYLTEGCASHAEAVLATLQREFPGVSWVGTSGIGVLATGTEYFGLPALVLMLAPLARDSFRLFSGLQPLPAVPTGGFAAHTALVHADAATPDLQELLPELADRTETGYLFGGLASGEHRAVQIADSVLTGGLSGVAFGADVELVSRVTQGCQPIGPARVVTRAERNFVIALDSHPALECALADLGLDDGADDDEVLEALSATLVGLSDGHDDVPHAAGQFGTDTLVRHVIGVDLQHGVLAIADDIAPGARLAFCRRNPVAARADLQRIAREIRDEAAERPGRHLAGALYASCTGRGGPHFGAPHAEMRALREVLGDLPVAGFFAAGEIARDRLYGYTGVLTAFLARD